MAASMNHAFDGSLKIIQLVHLSTNYPISVFTFVTNINFDQGRYFGRSIQVVLYPKLVMIELLQNNKTIWSVLPSFINRYLKLKIFRKIYLDCMYIWNAYGDMRVCRYRTDNEHHCTTCGGRSVWSPSGPHRARVPYCPPSLSSLAFSFFLRILWDPTVRV